MADVETTRNATVTTTLPKGRLLLEEMTGHEALGQVFSYDLSLLSLDPNIDLSDVLGQRMTVHLALGEGQRTFNGIVTRAQFLGDAQQYTRYHVTLRPWLWLLSYSTTCRIFQDKSVPEIIKEVFRDAGFSDFKEVLGKHEPREFCVQYRESDFDFVNRLMEDEGIYYFFAHEGDKHTLVMTDNYSGHATVKGFESIIYRPPHEHHGMEREHLSRWSLTSQIRSGAFEASDFDFMVPKGDLHSRVEHAKKHPFAKGRVYEYPSGVLKPKVASEKRQKINDDIVKLDLEAKQADFALVDASGDVRGIGAGALFHFDEYPRHDQNKEYLVLQASYQIQGGNFISSGGGGHDEFQVNLTLMDSKVVFRSPHHTPKARVDGPQTAIVTGPEKEEIWTDKYGRVKVRFHWDRYGAPHDQSSCWVRVSQAWAGGKWGAMHIPRVGQEVIVDFLEGDPDRPIITGRVYNNDQMPPYELPENKTQSGIKSRSTPKGGPTNFNELRFEDKKGQEQVYGQAEKDLQVLVKNDEARSVGRDRSSEIGHDEALKVANNRSTSIGVNETTTVGKVRVVAIGAAETVTVGATRSHTIGGDETLDVGGKQLITVGGKQVSSIGADQALDVGGGRTVSVGKDDVLSAGGKLSITVGKDGSVDVGKAFTITAAEQITLKTGDASIVMKKNGDITIKGKKLSLEGSGDVSVKAGGNVALKGTKVSQN